MENSESHMDRASKHTERKRILAQEKDIGKYTVQAGKTQSSLYREQEIIFAARNSGLRTTA